MSLARFAIAYGTLFIALNSAWAFAQDSQPERVLTRPSNNATEQKVLEQRRDSENKTIPPGEDASKPPATPREEKISLPVPSPAKAKARFKRGTSLLGGLGSDAKVFIPGQQVCALGNGAECAVEFEAGKHVVKLDAALSTGKFSRAFEFRPGKTYTFSVSERTAGSLASFFGVVGMVADNKVNQDERGKDNGAFTASLVEEK